MYKGTKFYPSKMKSRYILFILYLLVVSCASKQTVLKRYAFYTDNIRDVDSIYSAMGNQNRRFGNNRYGNRNHSRYSMPRVLDTTDRYHTLSSSISSPHYDLYPYNRNLVYNNHQNLWWNNCTMQYGMTSARCQNPIYFSQNSTNLGFSPRMFPYNYYSYPFFSRNWSSYYYNPFFNDFYNSGFYFSPYMFGYPFYYGYNTPYIYRQKNKIKNDSWNHKNYNYKQKSYNSTFNRGYINNSNNLNNSDFNNNNNNMDNFQNNNSTRQYSAPRRRKI